MAAWALVGIGVLPARAADHPREAVSSTGELTDREAARRRADLLRSPYTQVAARRALHGGAIQLSWEGSVPSETEEALAAALEGAAALLESAGWDTPGSPDEPLSVLAVRHRSPVPAVAGWDGRVAGRLARPVVAVDVTDRAPAAVAFDAVRQVAVLVLRQAAPDEAGWLVEGTADWLARRLLGLVPDPAVFPSPFLAAKGSLASPRAAAVVVAELARRLPSPDETLRTAWAEAGAARGDDSEGFLRGLAAKAAPGGLPELMADILVRALGAAASAPGGEVPSTIAFSPGDFELPAPPPLGWERLTFDGIDERAGLEIALPESGSFGAGRALVVYRGPGGEHDAVPLRRGGSQMVPLSGTRGLSLVVVDGDAQGGVFVRLRRVPDYPLKLASSSASFADGAVELTWRTVAHRDLLAWVVTRFVENEDGDLLLDGRELVPTTDVQPGGFGYRLLDRDARPGTSYRYRVAGLTRDGLLSEAFEAAVVTGR